MDLSLQKEIQQKTRGDSSWHAAGNTIKKKKIFAKLGLR